MDSHQELFRRSWILQGPEESNLMSKPPYNIQHPSAAGAAGFRGFKTKPGFVRDHSNLLEVSGKETKPTKKKWQSLFPR